MRLERTPGRRAPGSAWGPATLADRQRPFTPVPDSPLRGGATVVVTPPVRCPVVSLRAVSSVTAATAPRPRWDPAGLQAGQAPRAGRGEGAGHGALRPARRRRVRRELTFQRPHMRPRPAGSPGPRPGMTHGRYPRSHWRRRSGHQLGRVTAQASSAYAQEKRGPVPKAGTVRAPSSMSAPTGLLRPRHHGHQPRSPTHL